MMNSTNRDFLARAAAGIAVLAERFPGAFAAEDWQPHKPLKIRIHKEIAAAGVMPAEDIAPALCIYTRRLMYLRSLAAGGPRYGLDGTPCGEVTEKHAVAANAALVQREAKRVTEATAVMAARKAAKANKPRKVWKVSPDDDTSRPRQSEKQEATAPAVRIESTAPVDVTAPAPPSAIPAEPVKQRLGLADLKKAAQKRRAAMSGDNATT